MMSEEEGRGWKTEVRFSTCCMADKKRAETVMRSALQNLVIRGDYDLNLFLKVTSPISPGAKIITDGGRGTGDPLFNAPTMP